MKSYKQMAEEVDELKDSGQEFEGLVPVKAKVSKAPKAVFSFRLAPAELEAIARAADALGITPSDFVRLAALGATGSDSSRIDAGKRAELLLELKRQLFELQETARRL